MEKRKIIDQNWTLFLDRDGVINRRPVDDYVKVWDDFEFLPHVFEALNIFAKIFGRIIVVTNQQGIGKHVMTLEELAAIHKKMLSEIQRMGGRVDGIYFCPDLKEKENNCRKPGLSLARQAKKDFPEINFEKSIMAGDMQTDMEFGKNAGMRTVYINSNRKIINNTWYMAEFPDLISFAKTLSAND